MNSESTAKRAQEIFKEESFQLHQATDRLFMVLMILQWVGGVLLAWFTSPQTWVGGTSSLHWHVLAAIFLGGSISLGPIVLALTMPGAAITRHVIAVAQMAWSGLLIHLSGGRIETHFHVFGSLAFIAFYRDWRPVLTATVVTAIDHVFRGVWWPQSVFGVLMSSPIRSLEHAGWVVFEDIFLVVSCVRSNRDTFNMSRRRAELEATNLAIEKRVEQRTAELRTANIRIDQALQSQLRIQKEREQLYSDLAAASRQAGMAEVATGVLHNIGNILNSVNISIQTLAERMRGNRVKAVVQVCDLLESQKEQIGPFMQSDARGQKLPLFLRRTADQMVQDNVFIDAELLSLGKNIEHMKQSIAMQQSMAKSSSICEPLHLKDLVKDAIKINAASLSRHDVDTEFDCPDLPEVFTDRHKVMQILVNLIKNAKQATKARDGDFSRIVKIQLREQSDETIQISVIDNGVGITSEEMTKLFTHGFTTKKDGHGFGLHSAAIDAKALGGSLIAHSDGSNAGATFTLTIPIKHSEPVSEDSDSMNSFMPTPLPSEPFIPTTGIIAAY